MDLAPLLARLLLAGAFVVAGAAKLVDPVGSRQMMIDFGVARILAMPVGVLLPLAELTVAFALLAVGSVWWGALGALTLLCLFGAVIGINLVLGRTPKCRCFGQLHSAPVGWMTLARNAILAIPAGFLAWCGRDNPGPSIVAWIGSLTIDQLIGLFVGVIVFGGLVAEGWILLELLKQNGRLLLRIEALETRLTPRVAAIASATPRATGLSAGTPAPAFRLPDLEGEPHSLDDLRAAARPVLLVFSDPACVACATLLPDLTRWQHDHAAKLTIALISHGPVEVNRAKIAEHQLRHVLLQNDYEVADAYQVDRTPAAVLVSADGTIGSGLAPGVEAIRRLVAQTTGTFELTLIHNGETVHTRADGSMGNSIKRVPAVSSKIGDPAPVFKLPDLSGKPIDFAELRGRSTLLLFWNPACGYCQRMLEELRSLEGKLRNSQPRLLIISMGSVEANQAMELQSPILLDQNFSTGRVFGASGTPTAVLVNADGRIASGVVAGAPAVLALAYNLNRVDRVSALGARGAHNYRLS